MRLWSKVAVTVLAIKSLFTPLPKARVDVRRDGEVGVLTLKGAFLRQHTDTTRAAVQELLDMDTTAFVLNLRDAMFLDKWPAGVVFDLWVELRKSKPKVRTLMVKPVSRTWWWEDSHALLFGPTYEDETQALDALNESKSES